MSAEGTRYRERTVPSPKGTGFPIGHWFYRTAANAPYHPLPGREVETAGVGYPYRLAESCRDENHGHGPYWNGGPFTSIKFSNFEPSAPLGVFSHTSQTRNYPISGLGNVFLKYNGGFYPDSSLVTGLNDLLLHLGDTQVTPSVYVPNTAALEHQAYSKVRPKLEKAGLAVALAESRDIPGMLKTTAKGFHGAYKALGGLFGGVKSVKRYAVPLMSPRSVGDQFLNHNFGWVPFLKDLSDLDHLIRNSVDITQRLTRENDKWVKRKGILVNDFTSQIIDRGTGLKVIPSIDYVYTLLTKDPTYEISRDVLTYSVAVGRSKYYRPEFDSSLADYSSVWMNIRRAQIEAGLRVSPSNIYKATPWTWAIDWFTHFGQNVDVMNDAILDSVVFKYLYLMHHRLETITLKQRLPLKDLGDVTLSWSRVIDVKQRRESDTPYGFGLSWSGLSPKQIAILAALGVTR